MAYKLVCTVPLHGHALGSTVTDKDAVDRLLTSHPHHFVKVETPDEEPAPDAHEPEHHAE